MFGPWRIKPGGLSVSRSFGDIESKLKEYGAIEGTLIVEPVIKKFKITKYSDFVLIASDGVFDKLSDAEVTNCIWNTLNYYKILY